MASSNTTSILLVEEGEIAARAVMAGLERFPDLRVTWAASLAECLHTLGEGGIDVVMLDAELPDRAGLPPIDAVLAASGSAPVILRTAGLSHRRGREVERRGGLDYLAKDCIDPAAIRRVVLQALERRTQAEDARLHAQVFEHVSEGITITDARGTIISVNPAFCRITGYSPEEVIGKNPRLLSSGRQNDEFYRQMWSTLLRTGSWSGEIWNRTKSGRIYPEWLSISAVGGHGAAASHYIGVFLDLSNMKRHEETISHLAHHDALTGLPNRLLLQDRVQHAIEIARRDGSQIGLMFLDLDRFKIVNDSLGHVVGDELLKVVAERLRQALRRSDTVARLGGDEFIVMLPGFRTTGELADVAEKIAATLDKPVTLAGHTLNVGASIGIATFPRDGQDFDTLMKNADTAMYRAKQTGRNTFCFYDSRMNEQALDRLKLEEALRRALERGEFELY